MVAQCIVIEINEETRHLIADFNGGARPEIEENKTFFVIYPDDTRSIKTAQELESEFYETRPSIYVSTHVTFNE